MTPRWFAHRDPEARRDGLKRFNAPITRIVAHSFQGLIGLGHRHRDIVYSIILATVRAFSGILRRHTPGQGSMARHFWVLIHRHAGLVMTLFLILVGLTGSVLAFYHELDRRLNPELLTVPIATAARIGVR